MIDAIEEIKGMINEINFSIKPIHVGYKFRTIYQVSRLILIIGLTSSSWGCSILKLQVLSSALDDEKIFRNLESLVRVAGVGFLGSWNYNPLVSTAINYCNAEGISEYSKSGKLLLSVKGKEIFDEIMQDADLLKYEKSQLEKMKKGLSEAKLLSILERGAK